MDRPAYEGWFCLHRGWRENWLFQGEFSRADAWVWLIEHACWRSTSHNIKGKSVLLERGQLCASRDRLASTWRWSPSAVERFLARLQAEQMIGRETGQGKSVITICNYAKYQDFGVRAGQVIGQATGQVTGPQKNKETKEQDSNPSGLEVAAHSVGAGNCVAAGEDLFGDLAQAAETKPAKGKRRAPNKVTFDHAERRFVGIADEDLAFWARTYPAIDVCNVLNRIAAWVDSHPQPKSRNLKGLITRWLQQDQDSALAPQRPTRGNGRAPLQPENFATKDYSAGIRKDGSF